MPDIAALEQPVNPRRHDIPRGLPNYSANHNQHQTTSAREFSPVCIVQGVCLRNAGRPAFIIQKNQICFIECAHNIQFLFDTHCQIEADIKIDAYVDALRNVWLDDIVNE